ncbi:MAG: MBL fold metallo-hydrolase [Longimicrobiales bacterium]|nr:MBL fold metallo-hydrolase [Longimicrobiales bacterium]
MDDIDALSRRVFLRRWATGTLQVGALAAWAPWWSREILSAQERFPVVASEPWGKIERIAEGVWALTSTPLRDRTTLCNGGIVEGRNGVVLIEAFGSDEGFEWMAGQARRLTGRGPTHVVVTHYHADHTAGLGAAGRSGAEILATPVTRDATRKNGNVPGPVLDRITSLDTIRPTEIELGDRSLILVPRRGHTDSDVTVEVTEPAVVFCGDLVWNEMFPNYVDALPLRLTQAVTLLLASVAPTFVPGHGPVADVRDLEGYLELLLHVEEAARRALQEGLTATQAGEAYRPPPEARDWTVFRGDYYARAMAAWMEELTRP